MQLSFLCSLLELLADMLALYSSFSSFYVDALTIATTAVDAFLRGAYVSTGVVSPCLQGNGSVFMSFPHSPVLAFLKSIASMVTVETNGGSCSLTLQQINAAISATQLLETMFSMSTLRKWMWSSVVDALNPMCGLEDAVGALLRWICWEELRVAQQKHGGGTGLVDSFEWVGELSGQSTAEQATRGDLRAAIGAMLLEGLGGEQTGSDVLHRIKAAVARH
jgi:hypothetical protein